MNASIETTFDNNMSNAANLSLVNMALDIGIDIAEGKKGVDHSSQLDSFLRFPISGMDSPTSSLPTLDQVSVCSEGDDGDDDSSLCSIHDETESLEKRRSIFNQYWEKEGGAPSLRRQLEPQLTKTYERTHQLGGSKTHSSPASDNSRRRNIFNKTCWSESLPALPTLSKSPAERNLRKTQSSSVLQGRKPKQSCLRQGRFSSDQLPLDESESSFESSVRFSPHTDIKVFSPPVEIWASSNWFAWFA
jgi:hypothetical protein